jgi:hypothetical protein
MAQDLTPLINLAKTVLDFNWTGHYTQPGPRLYPHQWSWDSAFVAIGYAHYDQNRAAKELNHLFDSQWENGMLPQIVFNPRFSAYFPGVDFWQADRSSISSGRAVSTNTSTPRPAAATAPTCSLGRRLCCSTYFSKKNRSSMGTKAQPMCSNRAAIRVNLLKG